MRVSHRPAIAWVVLGCLLLAAPSSRARARRESNAEVTIISFGGTKGELKDCGCHSNPMGGLGHRKSMLDSLRVKGKEFLLVDLGDFMSAEDVVADLKNRFIVESMVQMGYRISTPGAREISDWNRYRDLLRGGPIATVASNLLLREGGEESPAGLPYRIEEVHGVRVAFFSLIGRSELDSAAPPAGLVFRALDPLATAREMVPSLRKKADLVVLLAQLTAEETADLLAKVPGIDVALLGREPRWMDTATVVSGSIVQETGIRGAQVGVLVLIVGPDGRIVEWGSRNDALGTWYGEDAETMTRIDEVEEQARQMITEDQQRKAAETPAAAPGGGQPGSKH